ncbi:hypothetical protein KKH39_03420 [Patescibacteria group bacterium]|nr:hypothetical protein [Patescibacteria group bacterium]
MSDMEKLKAKIMELVREGGVSHRYTRDFLVGQVAWHEHVSYKVADAAFGQLVREGVIAFGGEESMVVIV